jgi:hypothetical protein
MGNKLILGIGLLIFTMFVSWICELIASYYSSGGGKFMEYLRTIIALMILMEVLFISLPTERISFIGKDA